ncbi:sensor domain-containing diguanylate cyclase [Sideroxydans lithotrophicus]|uniref:Diguanylate cyclase with PAS/PAC sensor n=1 Tax=Sideroxydans lithotrophicus (strain ES-1) TaxID=580332 RepID=D5CUK1_SIDLE|nr:diguanylate cyclase [Sideroxydans lithotrophicus]ADE12388.1 diguanylate cyclase with PAS/PAC sensor [Sideroxydans lithotrophicus ES-1]
MTDNSDISQDTSASRVRQLMPYLLLAIAYVISGKLGLMLALPPGYASPIFPPAGIAIAAALIGGRKTLPWIFAGAFLLNLWVGYADGHVINPLELMAAIAIATASMLQAAIGGWALRRAIGYPAALDHGIEVLRFLTLAPVMCLTSATLSIGSLWALGSIKTAGIGANWVSWWVGDTLGLIVMLPIVMTVAGQPHELWRGRMRTVALPMLLVFAIFIAAFLKINRWEYDNSLSDFRQLSQQASSLLSNRLEEQGALLDETTGLFLHDAHGHVTREEFHRFVQRTLQRFPMIQALEWVPRVNAAQRNSFEAKQRNDLPGFEIRERDADGELVRAGKRNTYYPVTYVEPLAGNQPAVGFDLASNSIRQAALLTALKNGSIVTTESIHLVQDAQPQAGILILSAIDPHDQASGFVVIVLRMDDFMSALLSSTRHLVYTRLIDVDEKKVLYDDFTPESSGILEQRAFTFGTRHYQLETSPTPAYLKAHRGWQSFVVLTFGLLGTGLIGALLLLGSGYTAHIEAQVRERTRKLKESESRFHFILENSPIAIRITANDSGKVVFANSSYAALINATRDRVISVDPRQYYFDPQEYDEILDRINKGERISSQLVKLRIPNGHSDSKWALASYLPIEFEQRPGVLGWFYDITVRKQLEDEREEALDRLKKISSRVPGMVYQFLMRPDGSSCFPFSSEAIREIYRVSPDEVRDDASKVFAILHPDDYDGIVESIQSSARNLTVWHHEYRVRFEDGTERWLLGNATPQREEDGSTLWHGFITDVTERKRTEQQVQRLVREQKAMLENDLIGIVKVKNRIIEWANPSFEKMMGYGIGEVYGTSTRQYFVSEGAYHSLGAEAYPVLNMGGIYRTQIEQQRKDGSAIWVDMSGTMLDAATGNSLWAFVDITERKLAEDQIHHLAFYDALTQLPNRRLFYDRLEQSMAAGKRSGKFAAILMLDLDNFKVLNDTHGHIAGDLLLAEVATRLKRCVRAMDTISRFGGDEFVILLNELDSDETESIAQARHVAEKIRASLAEPYRLVVKNDSNADRLIQHHSTASIGVKVFLNHEENREQLLRRADVAMYQAKDAGRNRIHIYGSGG